MSHPIKHFITVSKHRHAVIRHCFKCGIGWQGLFHDLSKYSPTEFIPSAKYYLGNKSPNEKERELFGYSVAWMHHKGRNKHHFEYWNDIDLKSNTYQPVAMPLRYVIEMFCDRVAACKIYRKDSYSDSSALEYYLKGNARSKMHESTADTLEEWLHMLAEKGEKETFGYIKRVNKERNGRRR